MQALLLLFQMTLEIPIRSQVAQSSDRHIWSQERNPA